MLLGLVVAAILLVAVFSYQLNQTESAVVTTFGRPTEVTEPGCTSAGRSRSSAFTVSIIGSAASKEGLESWRRR
ncbi:MAG: hypothetical protein L6W00_29765 [Lentisphaeria bacterium]|nr:MAG: hypothetical protein L6W00_29765 [Lentisphaeria bacterium]